MESRQESGTYSDCIFTFYFLLSLSTFHFPLSTIQFGAPDRIRTCGLQLRRLSLYPAELRARIRTLKVKSEKSKESIKASRTALSTFHFRLSTFYFQPTFYVQKVRPAGLEPAAYWFEASRSIQLSYGRALGPKIISRASPAPPSPHTRGFDRDTALQPRASVFPRVLPEQIRSTPG